jgi:hypothetical protein
METRTAHSGDFSFTIDGVELRSGDVEMLEEN